jgi:drug/metabolite transporter (DMT)-like permease
MIGFGVNGNTSSGSDNSMISAFLAILLSLICPFFFSFSGLIIRLTNNKFGTSASEITEIGFIIQGCICIIVIIIAYSFDNYEFYIGDFLQIVMAGFLSAIAGIMLNVAITIGYAGVVYSLVNVQVIFFTIFAAVFLGQMPSAIDVIAALIGIIGSCIISVGPTLYDKIMNRNKSEIE